jgi:hypothetical protein
VSSRGFTPAATQPDLDILRATTIEREPVVLGPV